MSPYIPNLRCGFKQNNIYNCVCVSLKPFIHLSCNTLLDLDSTSILYSVIMCSIGLKEKIYQTYGFTIQILLDHVIHHIIYIRSKCIFSPTTFC